VSLHTTRKPQRIVKGCRSGAENLYHGNVWPVRISGDKYFSAS